MALSIVFQSLQTQLPRFEAHYANAHLRRPTLRAFPTTTALVAALEQHSPVPASTKCAAIADVLAEHRAHPHPLWPALLVLAFAPMLHRLRTRVGGRRIDADRDQRVVMAFLEAVDTVRVENAGAFAAAALKRATERAVFAKTIDEANEPTVVSFDENTHTPCDPFALTDQERHAEIALLRRAREREEASRRETGRRVRALPKRQRAAA